MKGLKGKGTSGRSYEAICKGCGGSFERKTNNKPYCDDCMDARGIPKRDPSIFDGKMIQHCKYCDKELSRSHYQSDVFRFTFCSSEHEKLHRKGFSYCMMCQEKYSNEDRSDFSPFCSMDCRNTYSRLSLPLQTTKMKMYSRIESKLLKATLFSLDNLIDSVCKDITDEIMGNK